MFKFKEKILRSNFHELWAIKMSQRSKSDFHREIRSNFLLLSWMQFFLVWIRGNVILDNPTNRFMTYISTFTDTTYPQCFYSCWPHLSAYDAHPYEKNFLDFVSTITTSHVDKTKLRETFQSVCVNATLRK